MRTGRRLHLDTEQTELLFTDEIYEAIIRLEAKELRKACAAASSNDNDLPITGFGSGPALVAGTSAGSSRSTVDLSRGGSRLLSTAVTETLRRSRH